MNSSTIIKIISKLILFQMNQTNLTTEMCSKTHHSTLVQSQTKIELHTSHKLDRTFSSRLVSRSLQPLRYIRRSRVWRTRYAGVRGLVLKSAFIVLLGGPGTKSTIFRENSHNSLSVFACVAFSL